MPLLDDHWRIAEDDGLRSCRVRDLLHETGLTDGPSGPHRIPKVVIQYWHDQTDIPPDVRECLDSWRPLRGQGFKRVLFGDEQARRFIAGSFGAPYASAFDRCPHPAMRSDYFRLCYISKHGGFYVDADEVYVGGDCQALLRDNRLKIQPLCYDTKSDTMVPTDLFLDRGAYSADWIYYVNNNPLIAPASHPIVNLALDRSTRLLLSHKVGALDIQSTTGPGNLTASLVKHSIASERADKARDFQLMSDWQEVSYSRWPLSYRNDERNWRLWKPLARLFGPVEEGTPK